ncbi:DUF3124 domain-containing protein [Carboxylicivirga sp. N1Y90]|uniref:DUF3124 domain-containing protein n=1 Tax=Carboxylicivirga fragile TaxID=3417571 RepID=UPI003D34C6EA|nr:DUF3124 domain-containing protein [Marinilabiliaceae bacterium N1Y90]
MLKLHNVLIVLIIVLSACSQTTENTERLHFKMDQLQALHAEDAIYKERIYVPVYTDVFHIDQSKLFPLTVTLSLRNTSINDTIYIYNVDYYNSKGKAIKQHIGDNSMLSLSPLESYDLVINKKTFSGDTGANFIVDWGRTCGSGQLMVQALMINTSGQQGLSFITDGKIIAIDSCK